jgi:hypothetical protein
MSNTPLRLIVGTLSGGLLMGLTFAIFSTILLYGIAKENTGGSPVFSWVTTIVFLEFIMGFVFGLIFGLLLSIANLRPVLGTIAGMVASVAPLWIWLNEPVLAHSKIWPAFLKVTVPFACGLVGLITSLAVSRISRRRWKPHRQ